MRKQSQNWSGVQCPLKVIPQIRTKCYVGPGGILTFGLGRDVRCEALNMGAGRSDQRQIWGLVELIFLTNFSLSELILAQI